MFEFGRQCQWVRRAAGTVTVSGARADPRDGKACYRERQWLGHADRQHQVLVMMHGCPLAWRVEQTRLQRAAVSRRCARAWPANGATMSPLKSVRACLGHAVVHRDVFGRCGRLTSVHWPSVVVRMGRADGSGSTTARERLAADHPALHAGLGRILSWIIPFRRRLRIPSESSSPMEPSCLLRPPCRRTD